MIQFTVVIDVPSNVVGTSNDPINNNIRVNIVEKKNDNVQDAEFMRNGFLTNKILSSEKFLVSMIDIPEKKSDSTRYSATLDLDSNKTFKQDYKYKMDFSFISNSAKNLPGLYVGS